MALQRGKKKTAMPTVALKRKFPKLRHEVEYLGNGFYRVESLSAPGEHYDVDVRPLMEDPQRSPTCPCKGFSVRQWCTHIDDAVAAHVRRTFHPETEKGA